ncbi:peptidylarginine deiminase-like enzyme [Beauveria brongniartii RCEF 3172]|uniref:Peptidylarginine deiminase-like enzyme n=1 Tax=Beauveria brongniartii RCEF 3172 TaxID=1081107 RepID=A0A167K4M7_9HYPO|nr:peptidylarginine deiminase-like enzyme [Beauveria brongniartii RCEF 3172]
MARPASALLSITKTGTMVPLGLMIYSLAFSLFSSCRASQAAAYGSHSGSKHIGVPSSDQQIYIRPAEAGKHQFIILSWPGIPPGSGPSAESETIAALAEAVARFEPVRLVTDQKYLEQAKRRFSASNTTTAHSINVFSVNTGAPGTWMRDIAPTFTLSDNNGKLYGVDYNFNTWGNETKSEASNRFARSLLAHLDIPRISASITTEGGAIEVDGQGTLIASESSIINDNRNPGQSRAQIEAELSRTLGIQKFIWVPGVKNLDATDFHIDAVARFVRPGVVLLANPHDPTIASNKDVAWVEAHREARRVLANSTDARGRPLEIIDVLEPRFEMVVPDKETQDKLKGNKAAGHRPVFSYVNYLLVKDGVILAQFGDAEADAAALEALHKAFPEREVVPVMARALGMLGGGLHCAAQEVPLV